MTDQTAAGHGPPAGGRPLVALPVDAVAAPVPDVPDWPPPAPPPPAADSHKHPIYEHAESLGKLITLILGVLYVLGILVSNLQLMDLGISDFSSLQARNVLTGFLFAAYFAWFMVLLAPIIAAIFWYEWWKKTPWKWVKLLTFVVVMGLFVFYLYLFMDFTDWVFSAVFPWGKRDVKFAQFAAAYLHDRTLLAAAAIVFIAMMLADAGPVGDLRSRRALAGLGLCLAVIVPLVMSDYANGIYPNIKYNEGGGQPQVAKIVLSGKRSEIAAADAAGVPVVPLCCSDVNVEQSVKTDQMVIWYQSDRFIYVSSLDGVTPEAPAPARVVAMDIKLVRSIEYLPKYVEIQDGNKIVQIYERTAAGVVPAAAAPTPAPAGTP